MEPGSSKGILDKKPNVTDTAISTLAKSLLTSNPGNFGMNNVTGSPIGSLATLAQVSLEQRVAELMEMRISDLKNFPPLPEGGDYDPNKLAPAIEAGFDMVNPAGLAGKAGILGMTAYHGTPHNILPTKNNPLGEFDLAKIGTGEGAQAYGHGIYLAETKGVAKNYSLMGGGQFARDDVVAFAKGLPDGISPEEAGNLLRKQYGDSPQIKAVEDSLRSPKFRESVSRLKKFGEADEFTAPYDEVAENVYDNIDMSSMEHLYEVDLPDEHIEKMLDWDAPLSEQEPGRRLKSMLSVAKDTEPSDSKWVLKFGNDIIDGYNTRKAALEFIEGSTGGDIMRILNSGAMSTPQKVRLNQQLVDAGIPGIKYFDGSSRSAGEGTRNFVIFDPSIAKITGKK